jgi:hypothetical protein
MATLKSLPAIGSCGLLGQVAFLQSMLATRRILLGYRSQYSPYLLAGI